jgi:CRP/FNR family transcriptional regulator, anaerobic regulatory protein
MKITDIRSNLLDLARCNSCGVRKISLFSGMTDEDFGHIHLSIDEMEFPSGASLFRQGEDGRHIFTIRQGMVKLNRIRHNGDQRIMRILRPGDTVGLEAIVDNCYDYDAIALYPVMVCRIPVEVIRQLDGESPRLHKQLLEKWHKTLVEADEWMAELTSGTARARLARLLLKMRNPAQSDLSTLFSRDDIGSMLCMTMETASRTINAFQREGKITPLDAGGRFYQIETGALEAEIVNSD